MRRLDILGVRVDDIGREDIEQAIIDCIQKGRKEVFAYAHVHAINIAQVNQKFREFLNRARIVYCDGEGVRLGARILGITSPPRTVLTRWIWDLGALLQEKGYSVFLLGGRSESVSEAANRFCTRYPRLKLLGYHHGYFDRLGNENIEVLNQINRLCPNVLFVGLGMPEQELWIEQNFVRLQVNAIIPCGGMIDYLSGEVRMAPGWMADNGMEWLHRLIHEPARLWERYMWGNPMFLFRIFRQRLSQGRKI